MFLDQVPSVYEEVVIVVPSLTTSYVSQCSFLSSERQCPTFRTCIARLSHHRLLRYHQKIYLNMPSLECDLKRKAE
ncbi:hypothetical protein KC19_5G086300 [Ceratodon purpureus]|uniref:Uncharacterized protein n=1 Tax=Ceratodon purpureus TaxID=3225 RepID=A0A8T0I0Q6_CERPU|nr:hypothetical protein KC19_5G086300 [Ceratodon purpureus]